MHAEPQSAPPVVAVVVAFQSGEWFDETLDSLAAQDYSNLRTLVLVPGDDDADLEEITARVRLHVPGAFVRAVDGNPGFGAAANEVLRLVEGDNGFFLLCHDDIALAPDALRQMVAEMYRSNAGIVGPKLVDWDEPRMLQHVGLGLDRFGEVDPVVDPGEFDQEQHDAVRDVFVLPSACLLVRADLFRTLGGFDPAISFHGDDVDLCWRAHLTGARVIVAPDAVARHRERLEERRSDLNHRVLRSRHRMRTVATLTGGSRLLGRSLQMVLLTLVELCVGLFTGRFGEAVSSLRALVGLVPRTGSIIARRREIRGQRVVHEREVLGLQDQGSSRLTSYLRGRETTTYVGDGKIVRRWREASFGPVVAWISVVLAIIVGSRSFIVNGVPPVGEFLPFPESPRALWDEYSSGFDGRGFGATAPLPSAWVTLSVLSVATLFRMALLQTLLVVGMVLGGALGAWRLAGVFPVARARIAAMVLYVGAPLVPGLLSHGDLSALVWYAALPWLVHLAGSASGLATADPDAVVDDLTDGVIPIGWRRRLRSLAFGILVLGFAAAFAPVIVVLWLAVGALLALGTLLAMSSWRLAAWWLMSAAAMSVGAVLVHLPWSLSWRWADLVGPLNAGATGRSLIETATLSPTTERFAVLALALYLPLLAALAIARAWRLTWSVRAGVLVVAFGGMIVAVERGAIGAAVPETSMLSVPVVLGLALGAAAISGGFGSDVLGRGFGWRQPVALLANVAVVLGLVPGLISIGDGGWNTPRTPLVRLLDAQLRTDDGSGEFRVLYVGDPRVLPVPGRAFDDGIAYAVVDGGPLDVTDRFPTPRTRGDDAVERALGLIAEGSTLRAGRLLAPLGIRYVVVPKTDGVVSTVDDPLALPEGLIAALSNQLDIGAIYGLPPLEVYVNQAWIPVGAQLMGPTAEASQLAGDETLARAQLGNAVPSMIGADVGEPVAANEVAPGVVHVAIPYDERIELAVDGTPVPSRAGFGVTTAFDIAEPGVGRLGYAADPSRGVWRAAQLALWLIVFGVAAGARAPFGRRRRIDGVDETVIAFDALADPFDPPYGDDTGVVGEVLAVSAGGIDGDDGGDSSDGADDGLDPGGVAWGDEMAPPADPTPSAGMARLDTGEVDLSALVTDEPPAGPQTESPAESPAGSPVELPADESREESS